MISASVKPERDAPLAVLPDVVLRHQGFLSTDRRLIVSRQMKSGREQTLHVRRRSFSKPLVVSCRGSKFTLTCLLSPSYIFADCQVAHSGSCGHIDSASPPAPRSQIRLSSPICRLISAGCGIPDPRAAPPQLVSEAVLAASIAPELLLACTMR